MSILQSTRVLIIDDHAIVRTGLRMLLESQSGITVVGEAANRADALTAARREQPNIILLDIDLGGESSLDCLPELLATASEARVLILTGIRDPEVHRRAVHLGAMGLVLKEKAAEVLLQAIEKVRAGEVWLDGAMIASVLREMTHTREAQPVNPKSARLALLTEREREVIALVGQGLRNKQVAERLFISETTVRHHLTAIFAKLEVADRLELVIYAYRHGLAGLPF
ncbi:MAG TPA: response regulator transcription factor [Candidatus Tectomicrobia bacterium]|jgi:DNA-binding NarL/FixJ family response regulator